MEVIFFIVSDGVKIKDEGTFSGTPVKINNKLAYISEKYLGNKKSKLVIVYDGKEIGNEYDRVSSPVSINGKLAYEVMNDTADKKGLKLFIVYDGKEIGKEYDYASYPVDINGKLAYFAKKDNKNFIVYDGVEVGKEYSIEPILSNLVWINNKLTYTAVLKDLKGNYPKHFIVYGGVEIGKEYDRTELFVNINDKLTYLAYKGKKSFIVMEK